MVSHESHAQRNDNHTSRCTGRTFFSFFFVIIIYQIHWAYFVNNRILAIWDAYLFGLYCRCNYCNSSHTAELEDLGECQPPSSNSVSVLAGVVAGALMLAVVLLAEAFFLIYCCCKRVSTTLLRVAKYCSILKGYKLL